MKRVLMFSFVVAMVLVASVAFATVRNFTRFSVDVPTGWGYRENESGSWVYLVNNNETAQVAIQVGKKGTQTLYAIANDALADLNGTGLSKNGDYYYFNFQRDGSTWRAVIYDNQTDASFPEGVFCFVAGTGTLGDNVNTIINSITINQAWAGNNGNNNNNNVGGSGGGGCNSVSMTLFGLLAGLALLRKK